jgi:hypothetical protein
MTHPTKVRWELPQWKQADTAQKKNPAQVQKERCLNIMGRKIACVQDRAQFKITPGMLGAAALLIFLLARK